MHRRSISKNDGCYFNRIKIVMAAMLLLYAILILKISILGLDILLSTKIKQKTSTNYNIGYNYRADILDRNGVIIARDLKTLSLYVNPKEITEKAEIIVKKIREIFPHIDQEELLKKIKSDKQFIPLVKHITKSQASKIENLFIQGLIITTDSKRIYIHNNLFSHIVGFTNSDNIGASGIELSQNETLIKNVKTNLVLTLDTKIQKAVRNHLLNSIKEHDAIGGFGIVMDLADNSLLGLVSLPDFNPNNISENDINRLFNKATMAVNEMGSVFKILTIAEGFEYGVIKSNDAFNVSDPIKIGKFTIKDYRGKGGYLSVPEILMYSSNIGTVKIVQLVGKERHFAFLRKMQMLSKIDDIDIYETTKPIVPTKITDSTFLTTSYGHGVAVTPLHTIRGIAAVVNGGFLRKIRIISDSNQNNPEANNINTTSKSGDNSTENKDKQININEVRVLSPEVSDMMRKLLYLTVKNGSGKSAIVKGYYVGGKTGTSEKVVNGKYDKNKNLAFFTCVFPVNNPKYLILVGIDEAKANKKNYGFTTGGMIAAPIAKKIIESLIGILSIPKVMENIDKQLEVNYTPRYKQK